VPDGELVGILRVALTVDVPDCVLVVVMVAAALAVDVPDCVLVVAVVAAALAVDVPDCSAAAVTLKCDSATRPVWLGPAYPAM
jgi:hypothetical protein